MKLSKGGHLVVETPLAGVHVVRFTSADKGDQLYDEEPVETCTLFRELAETVLSALSAGNALVVNFGLIERFPTRFYTYLLKVREETIGRNVRLVVCCIRAEHQEILKLYNAAKLFTFTDTEEQAVKLAQEWTEHNR
jgi:anti-anti-sigma regulatory factor